MSGPPGTGKSMAVEVRANPLRLFSNEDESLVGWRSTLTDARDRYANIDMGFPPPQVQPLDGMAVLATNLRGDIDAGVRSFDA